MFSPNMRYVVICVASILIFGCLIWLAWELEEAREPIRTDVLGADEHGNFVVRLREQDRYDLILHCDEEKFQEAFEAFKNNLEIDDSYPPLKVPGGPMVVALADELLPENLIPAKNAAVEYLRRHAPEKVVLVAHSDCLLYDTISAWRDNLEEVTMVQHKHLVMARNVIREWFPDSEVYLYYAEMKGEELTFYRISGKLPQEIIGLSEPSDTDPGR